MLKKRNTKLKLERIFKHFSFAYSTSPPIVTGYTPFKLKLEKIPCLASDVIKLETPICNLNSYVNEFKAKLNHSSI